MPTDSEVHAKDSLQMYDFDLRKFCHLKKDVEQSRADNLGKFFGIHKVLMYFVQKVKIVQSLN